MTNAALIARLVEAKEGSRALSDEVLVALGMTGKGTLRRKDWDATGKTHIYVGRYDPTGNLQDAVDLVPTGYGYVVSDGDWSTARASVAWKNTSVAFASPKFDVRAPTPALALSIAILKAMEAGDG